MLKSWLNRRRKKQEKTRLSSPTIMGDTKDSGIYRGINGMERQQQLYDTPRKINMETFYEIMSTGNLGLLKVNPDQKVSEQLLNDVWFDLQEYYYLNTNKLSFSRFKENFKKVSVLRGETVACKSALMLIEFGDEQGYEFLKNFGINSRDEKSIRSAILRRETKLELVINKLGDNSKKEAVSFYKTVAIVEGWLNRQLNLSEVNLERWVAYLNEIKIKSEAQQKQTRNKKWQGK
jgi:hypothetical protein